MKFSNIEIENPENIQVEKERIKDFQQKINKGIENLRLYIDGLYENQKFHPKMIVDINERINRVIEICKSKNTKSIFDEYPQYKKTLDEFKTALEGFQGKLITEKEIKDTFILIEKFREFRSKNESIFDAITTQL